MLKNFKKPLQGLIEKADNLGLLVPVAHVHSRCRVQKENDHKEFESKIVVQGEQAAINQLNDLASQKLQIPLKLQTLPDFPIVNELEFINQNTKQFVKAIPGICLVLNIDKVEVQQEKSIQDINKTSIDSLVVYWGNSKEEFIEKKTEKEWHNIKSAWEQNIEQDKPSLLTAFNIQYMPFICVFYGQRLVKKSHLDQFNLKTIETASKNPNLQQAISKILFQNIQTLEVWDYQQQTLKTLKIQQKCILEFWDDNHQPPSIENEGIQYITLYSGENQLAKGLGLGKQGLLSETAQRLRLTGIPTTLLIQNGKIIWQGNRLYENYEQVLDNFKQGNSLESVKSHEFSVEQLMNRFKKLYNQACLEFPELQMELMVNSQLEVYNKRVSQEKHNAKVVAVWGSEEERECIEQILEQLRKIAPDLGLDLDYLPRMFSQVQDNFEPEMNSKLQNQEEGSELVERDEQEQVIEVQEEKVIQELEETPNEEKLFESTVQQQKENLEKLQQQQEAGQLQQENQYIQIEDQQLAQNPEQQRQQHPQTPKQDSMQNQQNSHLIPVQNSIFQQTQLQYNAQKHSDHVQSDPLPQNLITIDKQDYESLVNSHQILLSQNQSLHSQNEQMRNQLNQKATKSSNKQLQQKKKYKKLLQSHQNLMLQNRKLKQSNEQLQHSLLLAQKNRDSSARQFLHSLQQYREKYSKLQQQNQNLLNQNNQLKLALQKMTQRAKAYYNQLSTIKEQMKQNQLLLDKRTNQLNQLMNTIKKQEAEIIKQKKRILAKNSALFTKQKEIQDLKNKMPRNAQKYQKQVQELLVQLAEKNREIQLLKSMMTHSQSAKSLRAPVKLPPIKSKQKLSYSAKQTGKKVRIREPGENDSTTITPIRNESQRGVGIYQSQHTPSNISELLQKIPDPKNPEYIIKQLAEQSPILQESLHPKQVEQIQTFYQNLNLESPRQNQQAENPTFNYQSSKIQELIGQSLPIQSESNQQPLQNIENQQLQQPIQLENSIQEHENSNQQNIQEEFNEVFQQNLEKTLQQAPQPGELFQQQTQHLLIQDQEPSNLPLQQSKEPSQIKTFVSQKQLPKPQIKLNSRVSRKFTKK